MEPHSSSLAVHFDKGTEAILSGGSFSNACGVLQSGTAAVFHEVTCYTFAHSSL